jgi:hypothetical protein
MPGTATNKERYRNYMEAFARPAGAGWFGCVKELFLPDSKINIVHPFNEVSGADGFIEKFLRPMMASFEGLHRRDYIMMAGEFENGAWVSSTGYFAGHFSRPWLSIQPTHALAYIRVGEFHRFENGRIIESYVYLDIPELMIAAGQWPDIPSPASVKGYTGFLPGPATQDGLRFAEADPALSKSSLSMVTEMLLQLNTENEGWRPYWHKNMVWYGPAAFGSFIGIENFAAFQRPFEQCFKTWVGGAAKGSKTRHFVRTADGNYVCSGGWPSLNAFQIKPFLGQAATNKDLFMRVCDWWRRDGDLLVENWVFVDIPHVLLQMGYDIFGELKK